jgi:hypothetical protein
MLGGAPRSIHIFLAKKKVTPSEAAMDNNHSHPKPPWPGATVGGAPPAATSRGLSATDWLGLGIPLEMLESDRRANANGLVAFNEAGACASPIGVGATVAAMGA